MPVLRLDIVERQSSYIFVKRLGLGLGTWDLGPGTWDLGPAQILRLVK